MKSREHKDEDDPHDHEDDHQINHKDDHKDDPHEQKNDHQIERVVLLQLLYNQTRLFKPLNSQHIFHRPNLQTKPVS
jgi:ABC-type Zn2+ transport system substrate-binding protein/surface adhesin